jgi:hypothetical protein
MKVMVFIITMFVVKVGSATLMTYNGIWGGFLAI